MASADDVTETPAARRWRLRRLVTWLLGILVVIVALIAFALAMLDTDAGHRTLIDRIEKMAPSSGLKIKIGRIDGSIYNAAVLHDVRLYDTEGLFFRASTAELEWSPFLFLTANRLDIDRLGIPRAKLWRLPALEPSKEEQPILPDFDIRIGKLDVERLILGEAIAGEVRTAKLGGRVDIRSGRADVDLATSLYDGDDAARLRLSASPKTSRSISMSASPRQLEASSRG